ncbi:hypothetical protein ACET3Z_028273 [Daucus carota]
MGRSPCCSKVGLNRGVWTSDEDKILTDYIQLHGEGRWRNLPKRAGLMRCGKSCRLRWLNYLRPDIKRGNISDDEEDLIIRLHKLLGNRWSLIAGRLPGRTDNEIKNYWNTSLRKKAHGNHTASSSPPPKISTKQNNTKRKDKRKRDSAQVNVDAKLPHQTPSAQCTEIFISPKPDNLTTREPVPKILDVDEGKMCPDLAIPTGSNETVSVKTNEHVSEPNNISQLALDPDVNIGSSDDISFTKLLSPGFSGLFGSDFYNHEENETTSTSPSNEKSMMEMLEEFWNVENIIIEPNLGASDLHFGSAAECLGDWLL